MQIERVKILAVGLQGADGIVWPGPVEWRAAPDMPSRQSLLAEAWDYCYFGFDAEILDCRLFQLAAEYAGAYRPDIVLFSTPSGQIPSGNYGTPEACFHVFCEMALSGGLFSMGNKMFSRKIIEEADEPFGAAFLVQAFTRVKSVAALAQPWVALRQTAVPTDEDFFSFIEHFSAVGVDGAEAPA